MSTFTGILLDVSASMKDSIGDEFDEEGGTWAQSIFTVIDDLVKYDISENNRVFAMCFGGTKTDYNIFDTIGTIGTIQLIHDKDNIVDTTASLLTIERIFKILQENGAKNIDKWANKQMVSDNVSDFKAQIVLNYLRSDDFFTHRFVCECLPSVCRDWKPHIPNNIAQYGEFKEIIENVQFAATLAISTVKQASVQDIQQVVEKATKLIDHYDKFKIVSNVSDFSVKMAASIIRRGTNEGDISKQRARELLKSVESYIYGTTPLCEALQQAVKLFSSSQSSYPDHNRLLFVLSGGKPTDNGDLKALRLKLKEANVTVVCCYFSRSSKVEPRTLHNVEGSDWEEGAKNLFCLSSTVATQLVPRAVFIKRGWKIDITNNETKLFMHVNHPDHVREACNLARNIVYSQDALTDLLASVSLDIYINQKNTGVKAHTQVGGTCYANASAAGLHLAMSRILGRTGDYPDFEKLRDDLIHTYGSEGANTFQVLKKVCPHYRLHCKEANVTGAMEAVAGKRPVVATFRLTDDEWKEFASFYGRNPTGILRKKDLDISKRDRHASTGGHAVVLTSYNSECLRLMNSWGEDWADKGFFRVENAEILGMQFIDVYWTLDDLFPEEKEYFSVHGSEVAEKLMKSLTGLQVAEYECPLCKKKSKVTRFDGSLSRAICPKCNREFSCKDKQGNILALNVYLTSLSR